MRPASVRELIAAHPAVTAALWTDLLTRDLIAERTDGALARLSAAMYADPAPWCPLTF